LKDRLYKVQISYSKITRGPRKWNHHWAW